MRYVYDNLDQMYLETLSEVHRNFEHTNSPRGQREREILGYSARILEPCDRFARSPLRKQNIVFNYAEALWYLSGDNDLAFIEYYAPSMSLYSADKISLPGTGYGAKLLRFGPSRLDQIQRAIEILSRDDPDSKRVVVQIFDANEDIYRRNIDVSCTLALQFLLREGKLHAVAFMRANDAYIGLLSDVFSFTFIQEYVASRLGCELGIYSHLVGSLHIYDVNRDKVGALLDTRAAPLTDQPAPKMPSGCTGELIALVLRYEAEIRAGALVLDGVTAIHDLNEYWKDILRLFCIYRQVKQGNEIARRDVEYLHPLHRAYVLNRWGSPTHRSH